MRLTFDGVEYTDSMELADISATGSAGSGSQTSDNSRILLWLILLFASGIGVFGTAACGKKRRYSR